MTHRRLLACAAGVLMLASADIARAATAVCATGKVTSLAYQGYNQAGHDPIIFVTVNGKEVYIGLSADDSKERMALSDMRATLLAGMLSGVNVTITYNDTSCPDNPTQNHISVTLTLPSAAPPPLGEKGQP